MIAGFTRIENLLACEWEVANVGFPPSCLDGCSVATLPATSQSNLSLNQPLRFW